MIFKLVALALVTVSHQPCGSSDAKARDLVARSLVGRFSVNVVAIVSQRDSNETCYQTIQVERSRDGKTRHTVLAPLCLQGSCSVDDGEHAIMYNPDKRLVIKQDSRHRKGDVEQREKLAFRNYDFRIDGHCQVAGMKTVRVLATPHDPEMQTRKFFFDERTAYLLKLETIDPSGTSVVEFETKDIQYPPSLGADTFSIKTVGNDVQCEQYRCPSSIAPKHAASVVGFTPVMPRDLPMGFEGQEVQVSDSDRWRALIIRLTDGLVRATVYEWRINRKNPSLITLEPSSTADHDGIRLLIVSDLPEDLRETLLSAFTEGPEGAPADSVTFRFVPRTQSHSN